MLNQLGYNNPVPTQFRQAANDWGRGDRLGNVHASLDRQVPFHYGSQPFSQERFNVTALQRSLNRPNDQLVPKPTEFPIQTLQPSYQIPAEHPYTSHIERTQMFPDPAANLTRSYSSPMLNVTSEREKQAQVNGEQPKPPFQVVEVEKTKGHPWRREVVESAVHSSSIQPQQWADPHQNNFSINRFAQQQYPTNVYPTPPTYVNPNSAMYRQSDIGTSPRTFNATINQYRTDRVTHNAVQYTGTGPADSIQIDGSMREPVIRSTNEFLPPRPMQGRSASTGPTSRIRPTYCKAPDGDLNCCCWYCNEERALNQHRADIQQMEAQNQWKVLNSQTPAHNIIELRRKYAASGHPKMGYSPQATDQPQTFYNHMGKYLSERTGLYRPASYSVNAEQNRNQLYQQHPLQFYVNVPQETQKPSHEVTVPNNPFLKAAQVIQDGTRIQTDSTYGQAYNTPTFLQQNALKAETMDQPNVLMNSSHQGKIFSM